MMQSTTDLDLEIQDHGCEEICRRLQESTNPGLKQRVDPGGSYVLVGLKLYLARTNCYWSALGSGHETEARFEPWRRSSGDPPLALLDDHQELVLRSLTSYA